MITALLVALFNVRDKDGEVERVLLVNGHWEIRFGGLVISRLAATKSRRPSAEARMTG